MVLNRFLKIYLFFFLIENLLKLRVCVVCYSNKQLLRPSKTDLFVFFAVSKVVPKSTNVNYL
jgi:hypothetical protein